MSITFAMILFGSILIYGGYKSLSVWALARGDNSTPKPVLTQAAANG